MSDGAPDIRREVVYLCAGCERDSGAGRAVEIVRSSTGGWTPAWEGRLCRHLTAQQVLGWIRGG